MLLKYSFKYIILLIIFSSNFCLRANELNTIEQARSSATGIYKTWILLSGHYQRSGINNGSPQGLYSFRFDGQIQSKFDTIAYGIIDYRFTGTLRLDGNYKQVWNKADDNWVLNINWTRIKNSRLVEAVSVQFQTPLINQYDIESKLLKEGFLLPSTLHISYGWSFQTDDQSFRVDFMPADLRLRTILLKPEAGPIRLAEMGAFLRFQLRKIIRPGLLALAGFDGEFSDASNDGYGFRSFSRIDWELWKFIRISMLAEADRDRPSGRSRWSAMLTIGLGFDRNR